MESMSSQLAHDEAHQEAAHGTPSAATHASESADATTAGATAGRIALECVREYLFRHSHVEALTLLDAHTAGLRTVSVEVPLGDPHGDASTLNVDKSEFGDASPHGADLASAPEPMSTAQLARSLRLVSAYKRLALRGGLQSVLETLVYVYLREHSRSHAADQPSTDAQLAVERAPAAAEADGHASEQPLVEVASLGSVPSVAEAGATPPLVPEAAVNAHVDTSHALEPDTAQESTQVDDTGGMAADSTAVASAGDTDNTNAGGVHNASSTVAAAEPVTPTVAPVSAVSIPEPPAPTSVLPTSARPAPPVSVVSAAAAAAPVTAATGFWARLSASKAPQNEVLPLAAGSVPDKQVPAATTAGPAPAAPASTAPVQAPAAGGSFWARLSASKPVEAVPTDVQPSTTPAASSSNLAPTGYKGPDGVWYADRSAYNRMRFERDFTFSKRSGELLSKVPGDIDGQPFALSDLSDCTVTLCDWMDTVHVDRLQRCKVLIGASSESVFLRNCEDCTIFVACKQLRVRDCARCIVSLHSKTEPVIEKSSLLQFAPFSASFPAARVAFQRANLPPSLNNWNRIFDFSKDDTSLPLPHWSGDADVGPWRLESVGQPESESPYDGLTASEAAPVQSADTMLSFDIHTGQEVAAAALRSRV